MRQIRGTEVIRTALLALCAGCAGGAAISGNAPERPTRERAESSSVPVDRRALYAQQSNAAAKRGPTVETTDPAKAVVGVAATHRYHRPGCALLKDVPIADQVQFTSPWDGLDGGYQPCETCRPGP
jgi:hypothetical protein